MGFRCVMITQTCKASCHANYLVVVQETGTKKIHLSEIDSIIFEEPSARVSGYLINALTESNIGIIFCNTKHEPASITMPLHGNFHRSKNIKKQIEWSMEIKDKMWAWTIGEKIRNQIEVLSYYSIEETLLKEYVNEIEASDITNREGLAAKVYFRQLFGSQFIRNGEDPINWALNYGYSLILMLVVRSICGKGYLTEIGIKHKNEYNAYNLACDMMEPFRPIIDYIVKKEVRNRFETQDKRKLLDALNVQVVIQGKKQYLPQAIDIYVGLYVKALNERNALMQHIDICGVRKGEL